MDQLPIPTVVRAKIERVRIEPDDVMMNGKICQRLGMPVPDELVKRYAEDGIRVFEEDGEWYAEPINPLRKSL